jgi:hypothetical protein
MIIPNRLNRVNECRLRSLQEVGSCEVLTKVDVAYA